MSLSLVAGTCWIAQTDLVVMAFLDSPGTLHHRQASRSHLHAAAGAVTVTCVLVALAATFYWRRAAAAREALVYDSVGAAMGRLHAGLPSMVFAVDVGPDGRARETYRGGDSGRVAGWPAEALAQMTDPHPGVDFGGTTLPACFRKVFRDGAASWEWRIRRPDGSWNWMRSEARVVGYRGDGTAEVVGQTVNIDREKVAEARAMTSARLATVGEVASSLAHEVRQPLTVVLLAAEIAQMALRRGDTDEAHSRLETIILQAERAGTVMEHLRRLARGSTNSDMAAEVPLRPVVEGTIAVMSAMLRETQVEVEIRLGEAPPDALGDQVALEQVLVNLVANACDAMGALPTGMPRHLLIRATAEAEVVRLEVADTGGGIAREVMPRLFEPFATTKDAGKGTGLGLSISKGLVTAMGGSLDARNEDGGAVFTLTLRAAGGGRSIAHHASLCTLPGGNS
jgi:signal transduction histidine kinase